MNKTIPESTAVESGAEFSRTLRNAIVLLVSVILITALAVLLLDYEFLQVIKRSDHSREVALQSQRCDEALLDLETGLLGYQLQGDPRFLDSYRAALVHVHGDFASLRKLVEGNRDLEKSADALIEASDTWLEHAQRTIDQRQRGEIPDQDWTLMGKTLMDNVRQRFATLTSQEARLRVVREEDVRRARRVLIGACPALVVLLALGVGQLVRRQFGALARGHRRALDTLEQRHSALRRSENELEQQKEWFRVTLSSIADGVIVTDKEGRVVFMNQEAEKLTGWNSVEALLSPLSNVFRVIHEATREKMENSVSQAFRLNQAVSPTKLGVLVGRSGQEWPVEDTAAPIRNPGGEMLGVVLVFRNATDIRRSQQALREHSDELERKVDERTANLQQVVNELETFSYTVSHDLRSPLRAMQGYALAVLEDYGNKLDEDGRDYLSRIKNAAERLDRLIQDLLSFSQLTRSETPLTDLDLDRVVREIRENYPNLQLPAAEITVEGTLPHVLGQESALTQIISNLLGNAAKFVAPNVTPQIRVWAEERENWVRLWIEDNGIGIAPADMERIFTIFVRANQTRQYGGTGVGLAIVKRAVQALHGRVGVEPRDEGGSRFWVELERGGRPTTSQDLSAG